jgi:hypothetical protein
MSDEYTDGTIASRAEALSTLGATLNDVVVPEAMEQMIRMMKLLADSVEKDVNPKVELAMMTGEKVLYPNFRRYHDNDNNPPEAA